MPTSSRAARAFGVMSSSTSAATPALSARQASPLSSARAIKIAPAIGLRQTFAVQIKSTFFRLSVLAPPWFKRPLSPTRPHFPRPLGLTLWYVFWSVRIIRAASRFDETALASVGSGALSPETLVRAPVQAHLEAAPGTLFFAAPTPVQWLWYYDGVTL